MGASHSIAVGAGREPYAAAVVKCSAFGKIEEAIGVSSSHVPHLAPLNGVFSWKVGNCRAHTHAHTHTHTQQLMTPTHSHSHTCGDGEITLV